LQKCFVVTLCNALAKATLRRHKLRLLFCRVFYFLVCLGVNFYSIQEKRFVLSERFFVKQSLFLVVKVVLFRCFAHGFTLEHPNSQ
jgi:hypothetical protein